MRVFETFLKLVCYVATIFEAITLTQNRQCDSLQGQSIPSIFQLQKTDALIRNEGVPSGQQQKLLILLYSLGTPLYVQFCYVEDYDRRWWLSWWSSCFQHQRSAVQIQSTSKFILNFCFLSTVLGKRTKIMKKERELCHLLRHKKVICKLGKDLCKKSSKTSAAGETTTTRTTT